MYGQEWDEEPVPFGPVVDQWQGSQAFLPDQPHHLIRHQQFLQLPWIVGTNRDDGAFRVQGESPYQPPRKFTGSRVSDFRSRKCLQEHR